jgi:Caspase domain
MKNLIIILIASLLFADVSAQEFSGRTTTISVDLTRPLEVNTLPQINWLVPSKEVTGSLEPETTIEAMVDSHHAISEISISVTNGGKVNVQTLVVGQNEYAQSVVSKIALFEGANEIRLTVLNNKGGKVSEHRTIHVGQNVFSKFMYSNRKDYALIFATDKYDNWPDLQNPIAGAEAVANILQSDYGFEVDLVKDPSLRDIQRKLAEYGSKKYSSQDQLFVYFIGNCYFDNLMGFGYLIAANSIKDDPSKSSYLSQKALRETLNNYNCQHILLAVDACCADLADSKAENVLSKDIVGQQEIIDKLSIKTRKFLVIPKLEYDAKNNVAGQFSDLTGGLIEALKQPTTPRTPRSYSSIMPIFKKMEAYSGGFGADGNEGEFLFLPK